MKKIFFILSVLVSVAYAKAQTGIGTTSPNASAKLDVYATDKGFMPPRVVLTATNVFAPIVGTSSSATGLLIYNTALTTNAANNVVPGYYYWNGTSWIQISNGIIIDNSRSSAFTLSASDNNKIFLITSASAVTVTVSNASPNVLPVGFSCQLIQGGAGAITLTGSGVTLNSSNGFTTRATNSVIGLVINNTAIGFVMGDSIF